MSTNQSNTDANGDHELSPEADETAHLEDVVPHEHEEDHEATSFEGQLAQAQDTIKDYWDQMMRLRAEIENNRKRAERDVENAHKYAIKNFVENLLPIVDSMEMGQNAAEADNATLDSIREGTALTMNMLIQVLERHGLEQINPVGEAFDPEKHQAMTMVELDDAESNTIIEVMQKGYALNERLVRPAMVIVAK